MRDADSATRLLALAALAGSTLLLSACGALHSARMLSPTSFGLEAAGPTLYVEPAMTAEQRTALQAQIAAGRAQVAAFYGEISTDPYFVACVTFECAQRFGSYGERAAAFGDSAIRLAPNGLAAPLVAHEWSHAELYRRVGGAWRWSAVPRWFDEGLAVVVAGEALHSEANWQEIQRRGLATPPLTALVTRADWTAAVQQYGETQGDVPGNFRVVYTAAGHAVRGWLACAGQAGALALLAAVRKGEAFDGAYVRIANAGVTEAGCGR